MFNKILVANRGEIAVRIMRTCRDLGIISVAVYSEPDRTAIHARYADEAYLIGPGPVAESYLNAEKIIQAAKHHEVDAIHPGYGFLSEQAAFAEACAEAGIVFIGPQPATLRNLGDKIAARRIAESAGVQAVPGTPDKVTVEAAQIAAESIGFPLLVKAAAGGGGKGIRLVTKPEDLETALKSAATEAETNFGDGDLYVEKYLDPVRHIEVQVLADRHGHIVHLGERECSIQRRSQKLVEEAPSAAVSPELRARLGKAAVDVARQAGYENAGTVEFVLDQDNNFYFIEANARLQVEHPVTELITGLDLVQEQIRLADGESLGFSQEDVRFAGSAIECRIMAEDSEKGFLPSVGHAELVSEPSGPGVRVDSSLFSGLEVSQFYDSLVAKTIVWGRDRDQAIRRMRRALAEFQILGIKTTIPFHQRLFEHPDFVAGDIETHFIERRMDAETSSTPSAAEDSSDAALVAAALVSHARRDAGAGPAATGKKQSNWLTAARAASTNRQPGGGTWRSIF